MMIDICHGFGAMSNVARHGMVKNTTRALRLWPWLTALACVMLAAPNETHAQNKVHRVGWLISTPSTVVPMQQAIEAFRQALRDLGYTEGGNLSITVRFADKGHAQLPSLASELVNLPVDIIMTDSSESTVAAKQATTSVPIVMAVSAAPVEQGFAASLARPGGNITGMTMMAPQVAEKRLELSKLIVPKATRAAILRTPPGPTTSLQWRGTEAGAKRLGLKLQVLQAEGREPDFTQLIESAVAQKADVLVVLADPLFVQYRERIIAAASKHRLPTVFFERSSVIAGGLMSYGPSLNDLFRRAATYADKILKGAKPGELPIEQPTKFDLYINAKTAAQLGLNISPELLLRADEVFR